MLTRHLLLPVALALPLCDGCPASAQVATPLTLAIDIAALTSLEPREAASMQAETERLWRPYGISIQWIRGLPETAVDTDAQLTVRDDHAEADAVLSSAASRRLGAVHFEAGELLANDTITLSIEAVRTAVLGAPNLGRLWQAAPAAARQQIAGRALGRVLAHEVGHYLIAWRGHADSGLMRASFDPHTLAQAHSDRLQVAALLLPRLRARIAELAERSKTRQARRIIRPLPEVRDGNPVEPAGVRPTQPTPVPAARSGG